MPGPYAVRVRTPDGWQDLAVQGAQGSQGPQGIQGIQGPPGPYGSAGGVLNGTYPNPGMAAGAAATNLGTAGGDLTGTYPNPTLRPPLGSGRVMGIEGAVSGGMTGSTTYKIDGKADGSQPIRLGPITPSLDCWWPLRAMLLVGNQTANWYGLNATIKLYDAAFSAVKTDVDGVSDLTFRAFHYGGLPGDYVSCPISGMFKLAASQSYGVHLIVNYCQPGSTWTYYRGGLQHTWIDSTGVVPR